ncbi:MAG TPA: phosphoribosylformylglycinamidine synthase II, partial [Actinomycetes bacterium]|nr:phosphoribosylformylglycinamidine synthase II [Actinomycetes bacterium]
AAAELSPAQAPLATLVSESPSRALVAAPRELAGDVEQAAARARVPATPLGTTGGERLTIAGVLDLPVSQLRDAYESALPRALGELDSRAG